MELNNDKIFRATSKEYTMRSTLKLALLSTLFVPTIGWCSLLTASASCEVNTGVSVFKCVQVSPSSYVPPTTVSQSASGGIGEAEYAVRADYGNVGIYLNSATLASSGQVSTSATAQASAGFWDEILVTSNTLAFGTPVVSTATLTINGRARAESTSIIGEVTASSYAFLRANYSIYEQGVVGPLLQFTGCSGTSPDFEHGCSAVYESESATYSFSFQTFVGSLLLVQGDIAGSVNAMVGANEAAGAFPMNYGQVSSLHSSHIFLSAASVDFVGATGHDYAIGGDNAAPVPEPSSGALLFAGLGACLIAFKRRKAVEAGA